jgi:methionine biosynthesis protein MetW
MIDYNKKYELYRPHHNIWLVPLIPSGTKVLDVGCGAGRLGHVLRHEKGCTVYGVDISAAAVGEARTVLHAAEKMDVEHDPFPFAANRFEVVIFSDVLEHLVDPEEAVKKFLPYLGRRGVVVASVPNVANISIRLRLLLGQWNYQTSGILDYGHLRFFTLTTMQQLWRRCGLRVIRQVAAPRFKLRHVTRFWPTLLANQFMFVLEPE